MPSPLRTVLHLSSTSGLGGAEMMVNRLASSLDPARFRSVVCLFRPGWLYEACQNAGISTAVIGIKGAFDVGWARAFSALIKKERIDLIHAHEFTANVYGTLVGRLMGVPVIATVHGKSYFCEQMKRRIAYRWVSRSARMVTVSDDLRQFVIERVGVRSSDVGVVYNGVQPYRLPSESERRAARNGLALGKWEHVIGAVGSLYPVKGHLYLVQALPEILLKHPRTLLLVIGRGDLEAALKAEAVRLGVESHIRFLGYRDDVSVLLSLLDVFVLPSLSEGLSMALLEAMAAGKPVVATSVGGNPELVVEGETGYLVPSKDPSALAHGISDVLSSRGHAQELGAQGQRRVTCQFSFTGMVNTYQRYYDEAIGV